MLQLGDELLDERGAPNLNSVDTRKWSSTPDPSPEQKKKLVTISFIFLLPVQTASTRGVPPTTLRTLRKSSDWGHARGVVCRACLCLNARTLRRCSPPRKCTKKEWVAFRSATGLRLGPPAYISATRDSDRRVRSSRKHAGPV